MSTAEQIRGDSERRQRESSKKYAEENGWLLLEENELADRGISAYRGKNLEEGALGDFVEAAKAGLIPRGSFLIVESLDRLSRQNVRKAMSLLLLILDSGINVVTLSDRQTYLADSKDNPYDTQLIISLTIMMRANEESHVKGMRVAAAWKKKRTEIVEFKLTKKCPSWVKLSKDRRHFELDEIKAALVDTIFSLSAEGLGSYAITSKLNKESVPTLTGNKLWAKSSIEKLLQSRSVLGEFQPHRKTEGRRIPEGIPVHKYFPQIIDEARFLEVQQLRRERKLSGAGRRGHSVPNLFSNVARCYYCGEPMHFVDKGASPRGGKYLRCSGAMRKSGCDAGSWRYVDFEKSFLFFMRNAVDLPSIMNAKEIDKNSKLRVSQMSALQRDILGLESELKRMTAIAVRFDAADEAADAALDSLTADMKRTSAQIAQKKAFLAQLRSEMSNGTEFELHTDAQYAKSISQFQDTDSATTEEDRMAVRKEVRAVVKSLLVAPDGLVKAQLLGKKLDPQKKYFVKNIIHAQMAAQIGDRQVFRVKLVGGLDRTVVIDPNDPQRCETMYELTDKAFRLVAIPR